MATALPDASWASRRTARRCSLQGAIARDARIESEQIRVVPVVQRGRMPARAIAWSDRRPDRPGSRRFVPDSVCVRRQLRASKASARTWPAAESRRAHEPLAGCRLGYAAGVFGTGSRDVLFVRERRRESRRASCRG